LPRRETQVRKRLCTFLLAAAAATGGFGAQSASAECGPVNTGNCGGGTGNCTVNTGYCSGGGTCTVNTGQCTDPNPAEPCTVNYNKC